MTDRLLGCFAKAVREKKELTEAELSSAYTEFMNHLQSITDGGQPVIVKLRRLRRLELELETYRHRAFPVLEGLTDIYLTKAAALVRMETDLLHFMAEHPGLHAAPSSADEKTRNRPALHCPSHTTSVPTSPAGKRTSPSCFPNSGKPTRKTS